MRWGTDSRRDSVPCLMDDWKQWEFVSWQTYGRGGEKRSSTRDALITGRKVISTRFGLSGATGQEDRRWHAIDDQSVAYWAQEDQAMREVGDQALPAALTGVKDRDQEADLTEAASSQGITGLKDWAVFRYTKRDARNHRQNRGKGATCEMKKSVGSNDVRNRALEVRIHEARPQNSNGEPWAS